MGAEGEEEMRLWLVIARPRKEMEGQLAACFSLIDAKNKTAALNEFRLENKCLYREGQYLRPQATVI